MNDPDALPENISERSRIEQALRYVALGVSGTTGQDIFQSITRHLAASLGVHFAFIGKLVRGDADRIQTLAVCSDGQCIDNVAYELAGTPCETVVGRMFRFIPNDLCREYPGDNMASQMHFDSYAGYPLFDSGGRELGLIAVLNRAPLKDPELIEAVLKIFSVRGAAELERLRRDEDLLRSEDRLRATVEAALDCIISMDADGRVIEFNPAAERCFGYRRDQVLGRSLAELMIPERFRAQHIQGLEHYRATESGVYLGKRIEVTGMRADGSEFPAELAITATQGQEGDIFIGYLRDITERKRAEDERGRLEAQLRQAQKMQAIGQLTGGIAHDFNNILTGVMGYIVLAQERNQDIGDDRLDRYLERAMSSGTRARDLIQQMLTFSRGQRGELRPLHLAALIDETVKLLGATLPSSIEIATRLERDVPDLMLDRVQVEQIVMNLFINARDAMDGSGRIDVRVCCSEHAGQVCAGCRQPVEGQFVEIAVGDTGTGIPPEVLERMFEPFYSTKGVGKGSGMGLAMVHGILHELGGHVLVETAPGQGANFRVLFPVPENCVGQADGDTTVDRSTGRTPALSGRVLVVDDDEAASGFMGDLLETWGIAATVLPDSPAALQLFRDDPRAFDLAILDQTMPHMLGLELARHFHELNPDLPIILYSGYSERITQEAMDAAGVAAKVRKPVDTDELRALVRELLQVAGRREAAD